ncbi:TPA: hypothetical protein ACQ65E_002196, partial [Neisseria meningitidis]
RFLLFRRSFCNPRISLFPQKTETQNSNLKPRHSRLRGNDGSKVTERKTTKTGQVGFPPARE